MTQKARLDTFAIVAVVFICALWGLQQVAVKITNAGISPAFQSGLRCAGALVLLVIWCRIRGIELFGKDGTLLPGFLVGFLFASEFVLIYWALVFTDIARGILFLYFTPFVVALGAHFLIPGERIERAQAIGLCCAFAGMALAVRDGLALPSWTALIGDMMMVGAAICWGATTLMIKTTTLAHIHPAKTLAYQLAVAALFSPIALLLGESGITKLDGWIVAAFAYQTVIVGFASFLAWFALVRTYPASTLSAFTFLTPLFSALAGALLLNERISPLLFVALALVAFGIWLVNRPRAAPAAT